jgi:hypothetical protein
MCLELQIIFLQKCYYHNVEVLPKLKNMLQKKSIVTLTIVPLDK